MNDTEIIARFFARDEAAAAEAETAYGTYCRAVARNITGSEEDAEECVNDVLLAAWNSIPPARPASLRAYLGRLTRNLALNRLEHNRAEKRGGGGADLVLDELAEVLGGVPSPEDEVIRREIVGAVNAFLASLDERQRALFVRRYWYAESVGDLARRFGMGENAVSAALYRIRMKLKTYLEKEGYSV